MEFSSQENLRSSLDVDTNVSHLDDVEGSSEDEQLISRLCDQFIEAWRGFRQPLLHGSGNDVAAASPDAMIEAMVAAHPGVAEPLGKALHSVKALLAVSEEGGIPAVGTELGDFELIRLSARGGMGIVYEALQRSMQRRVALKIMVSADVPASQRNAQLVRFQNEIRASANLDHPNIVPIYSVGQVGCYHFYAMRWIEGTNWQAWMRVDSHNQSTQSIGLSSPTPHSTPLSSAPTERYDQPQTTGNRTTSEEQLKRYLSMVRDIADALAHAHERGVIHRDIKPANLLIDETGRVWITDFGLAHFPSATSMTRTGELVGTLRYMSPEQASGSQRVDERSDIFSLGATLYELLLGTAFIDAEEGREKLRRIVAGEFPRSVEGVPRELETIVLKMTAFERSDRYQTAADVASDLNRWLNNQPIHARRLSWRQRAVRWSRLKAGWLLTLSTALIVSVVALSILAGSLARSRQLLRDSLIASHLAEARALLRSDQPGQRFGALQSIAAAKSTGGLVEGARSWFEARQLAATAASLRDIESRQSFDRMFASSLDSAVFSADLQMFSIYDRDDGQVVLDTQSLRRLAALEMPTSPMTVCFSGDHQYISVLREPESDATFEVWRISDSQRIWSTTRQELGSSPCRFATDMSATKSLAAVGLQSGQVVIFDSSTGKNKQVLVGPEVNVGQVRFSPSSRWLAASFPAQRIVQVWDVESGEAIADWQLEEDSFAISWSADESAIAMGEGFAIRVYASPDWSQQLAHLTGPTEIIANIYFHPNGRWLAVYGYDGKTRFWDINAERLVLAADGHAHYFAPDGESLGYRTYDKLGIWNFAFDDVVWHEASKETRSNSPACLEFVDHDRLLATGGSIGCMFWDIDQRRLQHTFRCGEVHDLCYDNEHHVLFLATQAGLFSLDMERLGELTSTGVTSSQPGDDSGCWQQLSLPEAQVPQMLDISVARQTLLVSTVSGGVGTLDLRGAWQWLHEPGKRFCFVTLSPDGRWAYASEKNEVLNYLWDLGTPQLERFEIVSPEGGAVAIVDRGGKQRLLTSEQTRYRGWELLAGHAPQHLYDIPRPSGYQKSVVGVAPSLGWLVAIDRTRLGIHDSENAKLIMELTDGYQENRMHDITMDSQGRRLAVACTTEGFLVWDLNQLSHIGP